ncbi:hypothetical protein SASPL_152670 [Salvia splendens]|uniref:Pectate lyase n=1 Tax=Salvia splendens TaxID=180675 RepID=A0A8X8W3E8_SALSN|nr:hypothetical protein SASPL_152670 [Salvia splendens]
MSIVLLLVCLTLLAHASTFSARPVMHDASQPTRWRSMKNMTEGAGAGSATCRTGNPIDDCWRCDPDWETNRKVLADCGIGFGRGAIGGRDGEFYVVTTEEDDPREPRQGMLRHAVIQSEPLWIIFERDMSITLKEELMMNSYKTIDGRGFNIEMANGPCITIQGVTNIIIHGIYIHDCVQGGNAVVTDGPQHYELRGISDGDGISIFGARDVWIDHCTLSHCHDGLIDIVSGSTAITVSNNYMFRHNEVMLMGHSDDYVADKKMQVTIAFNYFGEGLVQRMPRCRHGYFHVVNNVYTGWEMYAIGGSANPTINSQGNVPGDEEWKSWNWRSEGDLLLNGARFIASGNATAATYAKASSMVARPASLLTSTPAVGAGALDGEGADDTDTVVFLLNGRDGLGSSG